MTIIGIGLTVLTAAVSLAVSPSESFAQKRQRDLLTREEIQGSAFKAGDLHRAIRSLRPHFLTPARGVRTLGNAVVEPLSVYVNGTKQTGEDALRTIQAAAVEEVRFLDPNKAGNEFGPRANGGALMVKLHKEPTHPAPATPPPPPAAD